MTGLGTIVNMAAILIGSGIGLLLKNGIPKRLQTTISSAVGLCIIFVGITGAIKGLMNVSGTENGKPGRLGQIQTARRFFLF